MQNKKYLHSRVSYIFKLLVFYLNLSILLIIKHLVSVSKGGVFYLYYIIFVICMD